MKGVDCDAFFQLNFESDVVTVAYFLHLLDHALGVNQCNGNVYL